MAQELKPVPARIRLAIARLMEIHAETHPKRIAARFGLSAEYCKRLWAQTERKEWPDNRIALAVFAEMQRDPDASREYETGDNAGMGSDMQNQDSSRGMSETQPS